MLFSNIGPLNPNRVAENLGDPKPQGPTLGALLIRLGFGGMLHYIFNIRNPQYPILIIKAPTLSSESESKEAVLQKLEGQNTAVDQLLMSWLGSSSVSGGLQLLGGEKVESQTPVLTSSPGNPLSAVVRVSGEAGFGGCEGSALRFVRSLESRSPEPCIPLHPPKRGVGGGEGMSVQ